VGAPARRHHTSDFLEHVFDKIVSANQIILSLLLQAQSRFVPESRFDHIWRVDTSLGVLSSLSTALAKMAAVGGAKRGASAAASAMSGAKKQVRNQLCCIAWLMSAISAACLSAMLSKRYFCVLQAASGGADAFGKKGGYS
jgi:hypothetical protein